MSSKVRVKCPTCQVALQVKSELCGKQVSCPKCKSAFMLPALQAFEPSPVQNQLLLTRLALCPNRRLSQSGTIPMRLPTQRRNTITFNSGLVIRGAISKALAYTAPRHLITVAQKRSQRRKQDADLTEQESGLQASGIFLIAVPLITTLLPLFGVQ